MSDTTLAGAFTSACSVCGGLVASRFHGAHPLCRPAARQIAAPAAVAGALASGLDLKIVFGNRMCFAMFPTLLALPDPGALLEPLARLPLPIPCKPGATSSFSPRRCFDLPPRGGHRHRLQAAQFTQRRCAQWLSGEGRILE